MHFQPKYKSFITRVWLQVYKTILLFLALIIIGTLVSRISLVDSILVGFLPVFILLFVRAFIIHRHYLKSLDVKNDIIKLVIYKYNKEFKTYEISSADLNVRINQIFYSLHPFYKLQFYKNNRIIYQQTENDQWSIELLTEVYKEIKRVKGEKAHTKWIKH